MKIAFKDFLTMLRRYRTASVLNIAGLTLALTSSYVLASQVIYDQAIPDADRILLSQRLAERMGVRAGDAVYLPTRRRRAGSPCAAPPSVLLLVTLRSRRAAEENPAKVMRTS